MAPGRWWQASGQSASEYRYPVAIVPGHLTDQELDALT